MKKALLIAAVTIASTSAFASKSRLSALGSAAHLNDIRDVLTKPDKAVSYGEWATMEFGSTAGATTNAEGGFVRMMGNSALGAFLGNANTTAAAYRTQAATATGGTILAQENPIRVFYGAKAGDMNWGAGLYYSSSKATAKDNDRKQDAMGLTGSVSMDAWDAQAALGLSNNASQQTAAGENKVSGLTTATLSGGYHLDTMYIYGAYSMGGAKADKDDGTKDVMKRSDTITKVGVVNSHKKDGTDFFYGVEYKMTVSKDDAEAPTGGGGWTANMKKVDKTELPLFVGIEAEAASWMVLRGSITQTFGMLGLAKTKVEMVNTDQNTETTGADNTTVAAGVGIKWNKFLVDGTVSVANQNGAALGTDSGNFLGNLAMTYTF